PGCRKSAFVYFETSSSTSNSPKAPEPLACGLRSGTRSRSKRASFSTSATSWSSSGPSVPTLSECESDSRGVPDSVVEGCVGSNCVMVFLPIGTCLCGRGCGTAGGQGRAVERAANRRSRDLPSLGALGADGLEGDVRAQQHGHRRVGAGGEARSLPDHALDVLDAMADHAPDVVVIVARLRLVPGGTRDVDTTEESLLRQVIHDVVDGLHREGGEAGCDAAVDLRRSGMRMRVEELQRGHTAGRGAHPSAPHPVRECRVMPRGHDISIDLVLSDFK